MTERPSILVAARRLTVVGALALAAAPTSARAADTSPPLQPGAVTASAVTESSAALAWGRSVDDVGVEGYRVYRGPASAPDGALSLIATNDGVPSYPATRLRSGTAYKFGIVALDAGNNASPMSTTTVTTAASSDTVAPSSPTATSVAVRPFSASRLDVTWGASPDLDVAAYQVFRDGAQVATVELPNGLRYSDNGLAPGTAHSYVITSVDSAGNVSPATPARSATTPASGTVLIARGPYVSNVDGTSAVISWWTNLASPGVVSWGTASVTEHAVTDPAGAVQHHSVKVTGLAPGTTYRYQVGSGAGVTSAPSSFATAAPPGQAFTFAALGDFAGGSGVATQTATTLGRATTSFIQTLGDNIYPAAGLPDPDFTTTYSDFDARFYRPFAAAIARQSFFPANGNKEYYGEGAFWANFPMPGTNHSWYSYDWGDLHILVLDTEQPLAAGTPQYAFARDDLVAHQSMPWQMVVAHKPPYSSSQLGGGYKTIQRDLVPLFQRYQVDLVLSGNSHNYERTQPLVDGAPGAGGITYIVSGAGGSGFNAFTAPAPATTAFREDTYGEFLRISASASKLTVEGIRADTGAVFDSATVSRATTPATPEPPAAGPPPAATGAAGTPSTPTGLRVPVVTTARPPLLLLPAATWLRFGHPVRVRRPVVRHVDRTWALLALSRRAPKGTAVLRLYRRAAGGSERFRAVGNARPGRRLIDRRLKPGTRYEYVVVAFDRRGRRSAPSRVVTVTTKGRR